MKIGVFDSGLGGLTVFREFIKLLPQYDYIYLGDNARLPYGNRSPHIIYQFTTYAIKYLFRKDARLVILACNTATANALKKIQQEFIPQAFPDRKVLGVIKPVIEAVADLRPKSVGVIGTYATINSHSFKREIRKLLPQAKVYEQACPLLVPVIEEGETHWPGTRMLIQKYLAPLKQKNIDSLILGCTHYRLINDEIKSVLGEKTHIFPEAKITAQKLALYLTHHPELRTSLSCNHSRRYLVTDYNPRFTRLAKVFMGHYFLPKDKMELVSLDDA